MLISIFKGVFLIGVLSWYSIAIFSMINDYFRSEFNEYLKKNPIGSHKADVIKHSPAIVTEHTITSITMENSKLQQNNNNEKNGNEFDNYQMPHPSNKIFHTTNRAIANDKINDKMYCKWNDDSEKMAFLFRTRYTNNLFNTCAIKGNGKTKSNNNNLLICV